MSNFPKSRYGRPLRPSLKARDNAWQRHFEETVVQIDDDPEVGDDHSEHSSASATSSRSSEYNLRKAALKFERETELAEIKDRELQLELERLRLKERLAKEKENFKLAELEAQCCDNDSFVTVDRVPEKNDNSSHNHSRSLSQQPPFSSPCEPQSKPLYLLQLGLPEFKVDVFNGNPVDWPEWSLSFRNLVDENPVLTDSQKLGYLKTFLGPEPRSKIYGLLLDGHNYHLAMKTLEDRYGNPALVVEGFIKRVREWPKVRGLQDINSFYTQVSQLVQMFERMGYTSDLQGKGLLSDLTSKLPVNMLESWGNYVVKHGAGDPNVQLFFEWLSKKEEALRYTSLPESVSRNKSQAQVETSKRVATLTTQVSSKTKHCVFCQGEHWLDTCTSFLQKSPEERLNWFKTQGRCFNCHKRSHRAGGCFAKVRCSNCKMSHSTILHEALAKHVTCTKTIGCNSLRPSHSRVFLQTLSVRLHCPNGRIVDTVALLDSGSQATLIREDFAADIGLKGPSRNLRISNIQDSGKVHTAKLVSFALSDPNIPSSPPIKVNEAWTIPGMFQLPRQTHCNALDWDHIKDLNLKNVDPSEVTILIGANVKRAQQQLEIREGPPNLPMAVRTPLGWTVMGQAESDGEIETSVNVQTQFDSEVPDLSVNFLNTDELLIKQVEQFWETESFGVSTVTERPCSISDQTAQTILDESLKHRDDGHYEVGMLWSHVPVGLPNNRVLAERRFQLLQRRLSNNAELCERYSKVLNDYIDSGYARKLTSEEIDRASDRTNYLPHHGVVNPKKPEKLRVVFDAAAKYKGISLNDKLLSGPSLMNTLAGVLLRFRCGSVCLTADIRSMFHQVFVPSEDCDALRFLWKPDVTSDGPPDHYQMVVHIFGAKSSPCCANYCLKRCAYDNTCDEFSESALSTIKRNFYVDDMLKATDSVPEATALLQELVKLTATGGFTLTQWASNSDEVIELINGLDPELGISSVINLDLDKKAVYRRTLGVLLDMRQDEFTFSTVEINNACTKRGVLKTVSSIFDPLGMVAPFILRAKILLQQLWEQKLGWDDELGEPLRTDWLNWIEELISLPNLRISRCYWPTGFHSLKFVIHVFADASESAFGAVCYLQMISDTGDVHVSFVMAKTRVAPVKRHCLTLPRLELQAAVLAVRLKTTVFSELDIDISECFFWSDSLIVLQYIRNETKQLKTFVANRVSEIRRKTQPNEWCFVPGAINPADDCSRGLRVEAIKPDHRWFTGPKFLWSENRLEWPSQPGVMQELEGSDCEVKPLCIAIAPTEPLFEPSKYSSLFTLLRVTALCLRFCKNANPHCAKSTGLLTTSELDEALDYWIKIAQSEQFSHELSALSKNMELPRHSRIRSLTPVLENGVLRVGGRIANADIPYESKHQVILPKEHAISKLLVQEAHARMGHCGIEQTVAHLRSKYWIINVRSISRSLVRSCLLCHRRRVTPVIPKMAELPNARVAIGNPVFSATGCDLWGPMLVKERRSRVKRWGCIFTCLSVRAVHLELVSSLESDSFLLALRRFIARRGCPKQMYCDNGTNFVGASRELREGLEQLDQTKIHDSLAKRGIEWHFIPPRAPHMGGAWERLVQSVKRTLKVMLNNQCVHETTLHTFMCEVESIINSRPLTYLSSDAQDPEPLTPSHLLLGRDPHVAPPVVTSEHDIDSRKRWRQVQVLADHFWKRWRREYLPLRALSSKWTKEEPNLKLNDVVLVMDENAPRGFWPLARVIAIHPSQDGRVRTVQVKTSSGVLVRPVSQLCLLEES